MRALLGGTRSPPVSPHAPPQGTLTTGPAPFRLDPGTSYIETPHPLGLSSALSHLTLSTAQCSRSCCWCSGHAGPCPLKVPVLGSGRVTPPIAIRGEKEGPGGLGGGINSLPAAWMADTLTFLPGLGPPQV